MTMPTMPISLSAGGGGPSGSSSNAGIGTPISNPFNFDFSGWVVNNKGTGNSTSASGNRDANQTAQSATPSAGGLGGMLGFDPKWLLLVGAAYLLIKRR